MSKETESIFRAIFYADNHINGLINESIRKNIFSNSNDSKKNSRKTTRIISKLQAHKLIFKIPHSHRYKITSKGIKLIQQLYLLKTKLFLMLLKLLKY